MVNRYNQIPPQVGNSEEIMAISITEGCLERNKDVQVCSSMEQVKDAPVVERATNEASDSEIPPFHRHCQKTVCSAYSYNGTGKTWDVIYSQRSNLTNLPTNWIRYFTRNDENITQDLESILELINDVAATIAKDWHLNFYADGDATHVGTKLIWSEHLQPWKDTRNIYNLNGFSRDITLAIDENPNTTFKFNTMRAMSGEKLSITLPRADLTIKFNDVQVGKAENICMPNSVTFDINQDYNKIPQVGYDEYSGIAKITGSRYVYKWYNKSGGGNLVVQFEIDNKYKYVSGSSVPAPVVSWEFHIKNASDTPGTTNLNITDIQVTVKDDSGFTFTKVGLTDQMYVEPGKTNVYVFRADMESRVLTYSLAYTYVGGTIPS